jgi:hypothetical protein
VFVRKPGEPNTQQNLALEFELSDEGETPPPTLSWTSDSSLAIVVPMPIGRLVKEQTRIGNLDIVYSFVRIERL